ncbi:MAG: ribose 5-phosphate isomerase B [Firmicutes bacterium]|jgi:ribose 5-phosphate isomerase B|nr:ribose 5-phosphate isomerase B [Bacillota bacterium]
MKIVMGSDHAGLSLKKQIISHLEEQGHEVVDVGTNDGSSVDYPDFGLKVAEEVSTGNYDRGIVICGTGIGISIAANKVKGIRCAMVSDTFSAEMARAHNNANMIGFGERVVGLGLATKIVDVFLKTEFEGGRHERRVNIIKEIEDKNFK